MCVWFMCIFSLFPSFFLFLSFSREATEHFLTALSLQRRAKGPSSSGSVVPQMSESIWSTMRLAITLMSQDSALLKHVEDRDLDALLHKFGIE